MNHSYEAVFVVSPVLSESQVKEAAEEYKGHIVGKGGKVDFSENWGLKRTAYPISGKKTGFYTLLQFQMPPESLKNLDLEFRRDERVIRYLIVKLDKDALDWAKKRRDKRGAKISSGK